jgi:hypothetical protein
MLMDGVRFEKSAAGEVYVGSIPWAPNKTNLMRFRSGFYSEDAL